ncbi:MAG: hypothetical protein QOK14_1 [Frankiaceae bacterium]|nr:hypothetical protein [Frankiaceae bacterium]
MPPMTSPPRALTPGEWRLARDLRVAAMTDSPSAFGSTLERELSLTEGEWHSRLGGGGWFAAFADGTDQAVGLACCVTEADARVRQLTGLWVAPASRGNGVADALVTAVLDHARAGGASVVELWVVQSNARAIAVYERHGFRTTGTRRPLPRNHDVQEIQLRAPLG